MSHFLYLYRMTEKARQDAMGEPQRAQDNMQRWIAWMHDLQAKGHLKDGGQPLERTGKVVRGAAREVTDGPYVEAKDMILGFLVVEARDLEQAAEIAGGCPIALGGGSVEVRPVMPLML